MVKYKEFKIKELFESSNGNYDIQQSHINNKGYYVVSSGLQNCGIIGKSDVNAKIFKKNTITVDMFGNVFFRDFEYKMVTHARVFSLKYKEKELNIREGLYIASLLFFLSEMFSYSNMASWEKIKNLVIKMPVTDKCDINYLYMQERISELEKERISELETYLKVTGLDNYKLTEFDSQIINKKIKYKNFKINELFDIHPTKSYGLTNDKLFCTIGNTPVVVNSSINNGIGGYVSLPPTEKGNIITFSDTTTDNAIFYQSNDFIGYSHVQGVYPLNKEKWTQNSLLYFLTLFKKCAKGRFDYATKFNRAIALEMVVSLPIKNNEEIDYDYMEKYIAVQKKIAIKSVVDWRDKQINATKKIII